MIDIHTSRESYITAHLKYQRKAHLKLKKLQKKTNKQNISQQKHKDNNLWFTASHKKHGWDFVTDPGNVMGAWWWVWISFSWAKKVQTCCLASSNPWLVIWTLDLHDNKITPEGNTHTVTYPWQHGIQPSIAPCSGLVLWSCVLYLDNDSNALRKHFE